MLDVMRLGKQQRGVMQSMQLVLLLLLALTRHVCSKLLVERRGLKELLLKSRCLRLLLCDLLQQRCHGRCHQALKLRER